MLCVGLAVVFLGVVVLFTVIVTVVLSKPGVSLLGVLLVEFVGVVAIDVAVAGAGDGVDGAFALLEAGGWDFGGVPFVAHAAVAADVISGGGRGAWA